MFSFVKSASDVGNGCRFASDIRASVNLVVLVSVLGVSDEEILITLSEFEKMQCRKSIKRVVPKSKIYLIRVVH